MRTPTESWLFSIWILLMFMFFGLLFFGSVVINILIQIREAVGG